MQGVWACTQLAHMAVCYDRVRSASPSFLYTHILSCICNSRRVPLPYKILVSSPFRLPPSCLHTPTLLPFHVLSTHTPSHTLGTPGGALKPLTPLVRASTPWLASTGTAARVMPGTSLCGTCGGQQQQQGRQRHSRHSTAHHSGAAACEAYAASPAQEQQAWLWAALLCSSSSSSRTRLAAASAVTTINSVVVELCGSIVVVCQT